MTKSDNSGPTTLDLFGATVHMLPLANVPSRYAGLNEYELRGRLCAYIRARLSLEAVVELAFYVESAAFRAALERRCSEISAKSSR